LLIAIFALQVQFFVVQMLFFVVHMLFFVVHMIFFWCAVQIFWCGGKKLSEQYKLLLSYGASFVVFGRLMLNF